MCGVGRNKSKWKRIEEEESEEMKEIREGMSRHVHSTHDTLVACRFGPYN
jgi:hypothetical protein